jgi:hypothetical protein
LQEKGVDVSVASLPSKQTALHHAAADGLDSIVDRLLAFDRVGYGATGWPSFMLH